MTSLLDSGFLYALFDKTDRHHAAVFGAMQTLRGRILLPVPAITEVTFLINQNLGPHATAEFLESINDLGVELLTPEESDLIRSASIFRKYNDAKIDFVDACIVAMAERLNITKILPIDRRHFSMFRPSHCNAFEILP